jgi:hypothetical protein
MVLSFVVLSSLGRGPQRFGRAASCSWAPGHVRPIGAQVGRFLDVRIPRAVEHRKIGIAAPQGAAPEALLRLVSDYVGSAGRVLLKRQVPPWVSAVQARIAQQRVRLEPHLVPIVVYIVTEQVPRAQLPVCKQEIERVTFALEW